MHGPRRHRLCRTVQGDDARRLSRHHESGNPLERRRHRGRIFAASHGRHQRIIAQGGSTEMIGHAWKNLSSKSAIADGTSRRTFLKFAGSGIALHSSEASYARILGANDRVRVGLCGFSERFRDALLPSFKQHAAELNFEFAGLSDIWKLRREEGVAHVSKVTGSEVKPARNNAELLERKDIDA